MAEQLYDPSQKQAWARLEVPVKEFRAETAQGTTSQAGPLLTSSWHQRAPYNNSCPMGDGGRTVVGCVATATAQILKFWEWPAAGVGFHYYLWGGDYACGGSTPSEWLYADYSDDYDWANIPDDCNSGCTPAQSAALAELNYEVGVAHNMNYSRCGSAAATAYAAYVFPTYFKYKATTQVYNRVSYSQQDWFDLIRSEIDAGRPLQYRINLHSIVCDGYRDDYGQLEYHMNYGWNDSHNAWFVLDNLYCYWITGEVCPWDEEFIVAGIEPQHDPSLAFRWADAMDVVSDGDSLIMPGETALLNATLVNRGFDASSTIGTLSTDDPYVTITDGQSPFDPVIVWGAEGTTQEPFALMVDAGCPNPHRAKMKLDFMTGGFAYVDSFYVFLGNVPGFEDDGESLPGQWTTRSPTVAYVNEWHPETYRHHSGTTSGKAGGTGPDYYADNSDGALITPPLFLPPSARLTFWHWIEAENDVNFTAWDGGIVMIRPVGGVWMQIEPVGGYPYVTHSSTTCAFGPGIGCYSGAHVWSEAVFDLSGFSGVVEIMFRFSSDGAVTREGWYIDDVWVGNTAVGTSVPVSPGSDLSVTFESVVTHGSSIATVSETGPFLPPTYSAVPSASPRYYDLATTVVFSGNVSVCITYNDADITGVESGLKLLHYEDGVRSDVTTSINTTTNQICGIAFSLSPFVVVEKLSCCVGRVGDADGKGEYPDEVTLSDIMLLVDAKFISGDCSILPCVAEADVNQDGGFDPDCDANVTLADIMALVDFLFISGPESMVLPNCP